MIQASEDDNRPKAKDMFQSDVFLFGTREQRHELLRKGAALTVFGGTLEWWIERTGYPLDQERTKQPDDMDDPNDPNDPGRDTSFDYVP